MRMCVRQLFIKNRIKSQIVVFKYHRPQKAFLLIRHSVSYRASNGRTNISSPTLSERVRHLNNSLNRTVGLCRPARLSTCFENSVINNKMRLVKEDVSGLIPNSASVHHVSLITSESNEISV